MINPKISFLIPAYNVGNFIEETINSVLCDSRDDIEVIVVNDGSTDNTLEILNRMKDKRLTIVSQSNKGLTATRNVGVAHSKGRYIILLDGDDVYCVKNLDKLCLPLDDSKDVVLAYGNYMPIDVNGKSLLKSPYGRILKRPSGYVLEKILQKNFIGVPGVCCIRKDAIIKNGKFNEKISMSEDWEYWCRLACEGEFTFVTDCDVLKYRQHPTSMSSVQGQEIENFTSATESIFNQEKIYKNFSVNKIMSLRNSHISHIYMFMASKQIETKQYKKSFGLYSKAICTYPKRMIEFTARYLLLIIN